MKLSVIIVNYNTREMTLECLRTLHEETSGVDFEVLLVDNASSDGSAEAIRTAYPQVRLFAIDENLGFAGANNFASQEACGEFLLLLNPDTVVLDRAVEQLLSFAEARGGSDIYGGRTLFADGSLNSTSCWGRSTLWSNLSAFLGLSSLFRGSPLFNPEGLGAWQRDSVRAVDIVSGCFFLLRRSLWNELGGFNRDFFMYGEEADLCLRARRLGVQPVITPAATIVHYGGASERVREDKLVRVLTARVRLIRHHWAGWKIPLGILFVKLRPITRALTWGILSLRGRKRDREQAACWLAVWKRRNEWCLP